jgi:hypothetical protein
MMKNLIPGLVVALAVLGCGKPAAQNSGEATLDELNRALAVMDMGAGHPPADVRDVTNFPSLRGKRLPTPPAGKKLVIDHSQHQVVFVDE